MLFYEVHFDGTEEEIRSMIDELSEYDECFPKEETRTDFDFSPDPNDDFSNVEEIDGIAQSLASVAPNAKFSIVGTVENHSEYMDFEIEYDSKKLTRKSSDWYIPYNINRIKYKDYETFCDKTDLGDRVSKEQFDEWADEGCEIAVLDEGYGTAHKTAPLSEPIELSIEESDCCAFCGEPFDFTPIITARDGRRYHIWCAEDAGIICTKCGGMITNGVCENCGHHYSESEE